MPKEIEHPITVNVNSPGQRDATQTTHPAFGVIGASRVNGQAYLFGSDFSHHGYVMIRVYEADLKRDLAHDWIHPKSLRPLIEVQLSESQWAAFVSTLNMGDGVPCTIDSVGGVDRPALPAPPRRDDQFNRELVERLARAEQAVKDLGAAIGATSLSGKAKDELRGKLLAVSNNLTPNVEFVAKSFGKHVERTIDRAKTEVNAYLTQAVMRAGIAALSGGAPPIALPERADVAPAAIDVQAEPDGQEGGDR